ARARPLQLQVHPRGRLGLRDPAAGLRRQPAELLDLLLPPRRPQGAPLAAALADASRGAAAALLPARSAARANRGADRGHALPAGRDAERGPQLHGTAAHADDALTAA